MRRVVASSAARSVGRRDAVAGRRAVTVSASGALAACRSACATVRAGLQRDRRRVPSAPSVASAAAEHAATSARACARAAALTVSSTVTGARRAGPLTVTPSCPARASCRALRASRSAARPHRRGAARSRASSAAGGVERGPAAPRRPRPASARRSSSCAISARAARSRARSVPGVERRGRRLRRVGRRRRCRRAPAQRRGRVGRPSRGRRPSRACTTGIHVGRVVLEPGGCLLERHVGVERVVALPGDDRRLGVERGDPARGVRLRAACRPRRQQLRPRGRAWRGTGPAALVVEHARGRRRPLDSRSTYVKPWLVTTYCVCGRRACRAAGSATTCAVSLKTDRCADAAAGSGERGRGDERAGDRAASSDDSCVGGGPLGAPPDGMKTTW